MPPKSTNCDYKTFGKKPSEEPNEVNYNSDFSDEIKEEKKESEENPITHSEYPIGAITHSESLLVQ